MTLFYDNIYEYVVKWVQSSKSSTCPRFACCCFTDMEVLMFGFCVGIIEHKVKLKEIRINWISVRYNTNIMQKGRTKRGDRIYECSAL
jgi:hypothetical protein